MPILFYSHIRTQREGGGFIRKPTHIGLIPDGNRRWAAHQGLGKHEGYRYGLSPGLEILHLAKDYGIAEITYYGFTTDNCRRPALQVQAFAAACVAAVQLIAQESVSLRVIGNTESTVFPKALLPYTQRRDLNGGGIKVNFLVNYGWEWDLAPLDCRPPSPQPSKPLASLQSWDISRLDLIIRWGGMRRLSGFLPVQSVYADFFILDSLWPEFRQQDFYDAMAWYDQQDVTRGG